MPWVNRAATAASGSQPVLDVSGLEWRRSSGDLVHVVSAQVLLSCSHVFHKQCLESFER